MNAAILWYVSLIICATEALKAPLVRTEQGEVLGKWTSSHSGRPIASFQGIPYAKPPIGEYRFQDPRELKNWLGVWDATKLGSSCLQIDKNFQDNGVAIGDENCLFVNVYTTSIDENANLPVIVFIHGGAFMFGSGSWYGPTYLLEKDAVLVTVNYRLNIFGFLSTADNVVPGNMGLKDQSTALGWVRKNIQQFGGNPHSITVTGLSAGGASVNYQYLSPMSRGKFNRGVSFSGTVLNPWTLTLDPLPKAKAAAASLGCPTENNNAMVECLRERPAQDLIEATKIFEMWKVNMYSPFTPVIEPKDSKNPFLTKHPYKAEMDGDFANIPWVVSATSEEGLYPAAAYSSEELLADLEQNWESLASYILLYNDTLPVSQRAEVARKIKSHYLKGEPISKRTFPEFLQAVSDRHFVVGLQDVALLRARKAKQPVYFYRFTHRGEGSLSDTMSGTTENLGVSHGDDVFHIYDTPFFKVEKNLEMSRVLVDLLYSYATTGIPSIKNVDWEPIGKSKILKYLEISSPIKAVMKTSEDISHGSFWKSLGFKENERLFVREQMEL